MVRTLSVGAQEPICAHVPQRGQCSCPPAHVPGNRSNWTQGLGAEQDSSPAPGPCWPRSRQTWAPSDGIADSREEPGDSQVCWDRGTHGCGPEGTSSSAAGKGAPGLTLDLGGRGLSSCS